jgi:hypothetical protein
MSAAAGAVAASDPKAGWTTDHGAREARPVFIIGAPRSGTSITTWALGQHPNIQPMPETAWIASLAVGGLLSYEKGSERGRYSHLSNVEFPLDPFMARIGQAVDAIVQDAYAERCRRLYGERALSPGWELPESQRDNPMQIRRRGDEPKQRWIDGTPLNSYYITALLKLFPQARLIHNLRRPEEVATSLEGFDKVGAKPQALEEGLQTWIGHTENAWYAERGLGRGRVFRLDFQRLADDPETLFRELCAFLDEPFAAECLLPLQRKLNSSQVDDRREANLQRLRANRVFKRAQDVYEAVRAQPGDDHPDASALQVLDQRLADYCRDRVII